MALKFGPKHPRMVEIDQQINKVQNQINNEVELARRQVSDEYQGALALKRSAKASWSTGRCGVSPEYGRGGICDSAAPGGIDPGPLRYPGNEAEGGEHFGGNVGGEYHGNRPRNRSLCSDCAAKEQGTDLWTVRRFICRVRAGICDRIGRRQVADLGGGRGGVDAAFAGSHTEHGVWRDKASRRSQRESPTEHIPDAAPADHLVGSKIPRRRGVPWNAKLSSTFLN